jgi:hypothetical protein
VADAKASVVQRYGSEALKNFILGQTLSAALSLGSTQRSVLNEINSVEGEGHADVGFPGSRL